MPRRTAAPGGTCCARRLSLHWLRSPGAVYAGTVDGTILRGSDDEWHTIARGAAAVRRLGVLRDRRVAAVYDDASIVLLDGDSAVISDIAVSGPLAVVSSAADPAVIFVVARSGVHTPAGFHPLDGTATGAVVLLAGTSEVLLIGTEQSTLRSEDGGATFSVVEGPGGCPGARLARSLSGLCVCGTGAGELWLSSDRGRTWRRLHAGMPPSMIYRLLAFSELPAECCNVNSFEPITRLRFLPEW
jgi:hypothetical protein